jgi:hypothetical protein
VFLTGFRSLFGEKIASSYMLAIFSPPCRLFEDDLYSKYRAMDLFQGTNIVFDTSNTDQANAQLKMLRKLCLDDLLECYLGTL